MTLNTEQNLRVYIIVDLFFLSFLLSLFLTEAKSYCVAQVDLELTV